MPAANARLTWTSVPRWHAPELPPAASYLAYWFGEAARNQAETLLAAADPAVPVQRAGQESAHWDAAAEADLRRLITASRAGVRIILAGPESVVLRAVALAKELGATTEEIIPIATEAAKTKQTAQTEPTYITGPAPRRVFCAACRQSFDAVAPIGGQATCPDCNADLIVDHRFSTPHAAYFGWPTGLDLHR